MYPISRILLLVIASLALPLLGSCGSESKQDSSNAPTLTFAHDGLINHSTNHFYQFDDFLFAATDKGLFVKKLSAQDTWKSAGLNSADLRYLAIFSKDHYLALTYHTVAGEAVYRLMETTDAGINWHPVEHNFGGETEEAIIALHYDQGHHRLFAKGLAVLAVSYDEGRIWKKLAGDWHGTGQPLTMIKHNPHTNEIWYAEQNALGQMQLCAYALDNDSERCFSKIMPESGAILDIEFDRNNPSHLLVSGQGGLARSVNNGEEWARLTSENKHRFYPDIVLDPQNSRTLYTGGWDTRWDAPQPLILEISKDGGATWTKFFYPSSTLFGGVKSLVMVNESTQKILYIGLHRGGIVKATLP